MVIVRKKKKKKKKVVLIGDFAYSLREHPHMFYAPSFTLLYSRKGEMRGTQNEGLFSGPDLNGKRRSHNLIKLYRIYIIR